MGRVVIEPRHIAQGHDAVLIRREGRVLARVKAHIACGGVNEARRIQGIPAHHAANGIGKQLLDAVRSQPFLQCVPGSVICLFRVHAVPIEGVAGQGDLLEGHIRRQFVLQAVGLNEYPVVFLFQLLHFISHDLPLCPHASIGFLKIAGAMLWEQQGQALEIP